MPLFGSGHSTLVSDEAPYFESLRDLDDWTIRSNTASRRLTGVLPYHPRSRVEVTTSESTGKLLVCHDYKGGYTEKPSALSYTFNFWSTCDTFIYFSHHRVTIPPSGWTNASHKQGVKMLGTLIFEGSGEEDCLRLILGRPPKACTGPAIPPQTNNYNKWAISPHYASLLADLARQRGFDGYLLNVECPLRGGVEQTRALAAWILLLQAELRAKVGPHAEAIWYDSVIITGNLAWQDRLNSLNLPFFLSSSSFFTNYTWPPHYPSLSAQFYLSLDPTLTSNPGHPHTPSKSLNTIYTGVDVWGRGSHGGGGFGCYKAIQHIDPQFLGLSVALFGQAWTWESEQDKPGWSWDVWWAYERGLWVGTGKDGEVALPLPVPPPPEPEKKDEKPIPPECPHGPFVPISSFFVQQPPPNPASLSFYTSFSPGVGRAWFVKGAKVLPAGSGWTDVDKQCSLGDLLWPLPKVSWDDGGIGSLLERGESLPEAKATIDFDDAWMGGSSLKLDVTCAGTDAEDAFFRCMWLPIQSLATTPNQSYEATLVYKCDHSAVQASLEIGLSVKTLGGGVSGDVEVKPVVLGDGMGNEGEGWTGLAIQFSVPGDGDGDILSVIGLVVGMAAEDPSETSSFAVQLGQLTVRPTPPTTVPAHAHKILWADFSSDPTSNPNATGISGTLTWDTASSFSALTTISLTSPEDPIPAWILPASEHWFPTFLYFNIYAAMPLGLVGQPPSPERATFVGTTGLDGRGNRFYVEPALLPEVMRGVRAVRFYVQGVTDVGDVLRWEHCAFVDVSMD
ncbi:glycoside hydrolase family 85 protein [Jaapia argillacea MUCL 33604]|uniref:Glycoside hydrolase family 85 protein n=1 Tax=Jaapia argillacea MUCL 33604 TaxID=933084 RepID=A0A067P7J6_9AGAM|nr:glycoside hydrolase family 85 protein [Jaapia argillacea MUCL 33604]